MTSPELDREATRLDPTRLTYEQAKMEQYHQYLVLNPGVFGNDAWNFVEHLDRVGPDGWADFIGSTRLNEVMIYHQIPGDAMRGWSRRAVADIIVRCLEAHRGKSR